MKMASRLIDLISKKKKANCTCGTLFLLITKLRIYSCLACVYRVMDARRKFGENERYMRKISPRATLAS